jgi:hypothetical protein
MPAFDSVSGDVAAHAAGSKKAEVKEAEVKKTKWFTSVICANVVLYFPVAVLSARARVSPGGIQFDATPQRLGYLGQREGRELRPLSLIHVHVCVHIVGRGQLTSKATAAATAACTASSSAAPTPGRAAPSARNALRNARSWVGPSSASPATAAPAPFLPCRVGQAASALSPQGEEADAREKEEWSWWAHTGGGNGPCLQTTHTTI